jgi:hypothetical protein
MYDVDLAKKLILEMGGLCGIYTFKDHCIENQDIEGQDTADQNEKSVAPNVSLNTSGQPVPRWELITTALVGIILQVGVLVYDSFITYSSGAGVKWNKGGRPVAGYAFPLTAVGTVAIGVGMFICAHVIEASTVKIKHKVRPGCSGGRCQVVWIQRNGKVSDQEFGSYAIFAQKNKEEIIHSRVLKEQKYMLEVETSVGVVITLAGMLPS